MIRAAIFGFAVLREKRVILMQWKKLKVNIRKNGR